MKKSILLTIAVSLILILALSAYVYAIGTSTIPSSTATQKVNSNQTTQNASKKMMDCDSPTNRMERIKCRLSQNATDEEIDYEKRVPEACATLRNPTACIALYKRVQTNKCYNLDGQQKDRCLKRTINMTKVKFRDLPTAERAQKAKDYIILLLYDLEDRAEKAYKSGAITADGSADIIELITQIKQDILEGKKKPEIVSELNELKQKWRFYLINTK